MSLLLLLGCFLGRSKASGRSKDGMLISSSNSDVVYGQKPLTEPEEQTEA